MKTLESQDLHPRQQCIDNIYRLFYMHCVNKEMDFFRLISYGVQDTIFAVAPGRKFDHLKQEIFAVLLLNHYHKKYTHTHARTHAHNENT